MEKVKTRSAKRVTVKKAPEDKAAKPSLMKSVVKKVASVTSRKKNASAEEFIRRVQSKAYELYASRGYMDGNDTADWIEAERIVRSELGL